MVSRTIGLELLQHNTLSRPTRVALYLVEGATLLTGISARFEIGAPSVSPGSRQTEGYVVPLAGTANRTTGNMVQFNLTSVAL